MSSVHQSGQKSRYGHLTHAGRRELRWALVEAAWSAVRYHDLWQRMPANKAIVAIAHKLLVVLLSVLTEHTTHRDLDPNRLAMKLLGWSWRLSEVHRGGLTHRQFVRLQLMRLGVGAAACRRDLTHIVPPKGDRRYRLPSEDEVRARLANLDLGQVADPPVIDIG